MKVICFMALFLFLLTGLTYMLRRDSDMKRRFAGFYYQPRDTLDVIYIGSSPVHPYWAASLAWHEYGFTSWPLATNIQQPSYTIYLLKEAIKRQSPKAVIFELRMFTRSQAAFDERDTYEAFARNATDNLRYSLNRYKLIKNTVKPSEDLISYYFDIIKYHSLWKSVSKSNWGYVSFSKKDENSGHLIRDEVIDLSDSWHDYSDITELSPMPPEQEKVLRSLLDYCRENSIPALFTVNPYTDIQEETQKQFNYMKAIVEEEYGYPFINFNLLYDELDIDFARDFYNGGHMNTNGAVKFTRYLAAFLSEHYNLEDKRQNEEYSSWNASYEIWRKRADAAIETINTKVKEGTYDE